jgi:hypothetical protein
MIIRSLAVSAILLACLQVSAAPDKGLKVAVEIERDGQTLAKPSIWQSSGTAGEISMQNEFRLRITPTLKVDKADVKFEIFTTQDGIESAVGSPRIITKVGERCSLAWKTSNGMNYKLSVLVSETEKPVQ